MRTRKIIATAAVAGLVGAGAVVTPMVLAADDDPTSESETSRPYGPRWADEDSDSWMGRGMGRMHGPGGMGGYGMGRGGQGGYGMGPGAQGQRGSGGCPFAEDGAAAGTLTGQQEQTLLEQAEHEKLARDVYLAFSDSTGDHRFERVAASEAHHLEALRVLLDRYDLTDPTEGLEEGKFRSDTVAGTYEDYLAQGEDLDGALEVARQIERDDIAGLTEAAEGLDAASDVQRVYRMQAMASERHLEVFSR